MGHRWLGSSGIQSYHTACSLPKGVAVSPIIVERRDRLLPTGITATARTICAGWTTEQLQGCIEGGQLQPALRLLGTNLQPKPDTAMACATESSWKAFQHACKHPHSMEVRCKLLT